MTRAILTGYIVVASLAHAGCANSPTSSEKAYELKGKVVAIELSEKRLKIDHEDIPGLMKAMQMTFFVDSPAMLDGLALGDAVEGKFKAVSGKYFITEMHKAGMASTEESEAIKKSLAKLDEADRKLAEQQRQCPIANEPLGSMGAPIKLTIKGEPVFVCCQGCKDRAEKNADKTLKRVAELKSGH